MNIKVENLENSTAKITVELEPSKLDVAIENAYKKNKNKFSLPGFRKGKVPFAMIEKMYGVEVFFEDAANELVNNTYADAVEESGLEVVAQPDISLVQIEKDKPFIYDAVVTVKPEIKLGKYKGVKVEKIDTTVTDEDVAAEIDKVRDQNSRIVSNQDKEIEEGDTAVIDFDGYVDGEQFEGGKAENYDLVIGSHSFIDTFEDQLVGKKVGDELDVNVTFPEDYQAENLAGKPAVFKVKVNDIKVKELPDVDDEFVQDISSFDTVDEYKADLKKNLEEQKQAEARREKENNVIEAIVKDSDMDIPEKMIDAEADRLIQEYAQNMAAQGISFEQYMKITGATMDQIKEQMKPQAKARIETDLVLEAVIKAENIEASDEDYDREMDTMAQQYQMDKEKITGLIGEAEKEHIMDNIRKRKAADFVVDAAK